MPVSCCVLLYCFISRGCILHYFIACSVSKLLWVYCLGHAEWRGMIEQIDGWAKQPSQVACFSEGLQCWGAWDTTCRYKAKDITPLIASRREAWKEEALDDLPWKDERGGIVNQTNLGTVSKAKLRKLLREGVECIYGLFQAHLEPSWTVAGDSPCASNNGGCEQLCFALPNPNNTTPDTAKCGCASGALSSDGKTCQGDGLLVMSLCSVLILCIWRYSGTVETGHITWKSFKIKVVVGL